MIRLIYYSSLLITLFLFNLSTVSGQSSIYSQKRGGVMISIDDTPNSDSKVYTWEGIRLLFNKYNYKFNIALQSEGLNMPSVAAKVKQMMDDGHEIMDHCPQENVFEFNFANLEDDAKYYDGKTGYDFYNGQPGVQSVRKNGDKIGDRVYVTLKAGAYLDPTALPVLAERTRLLYRRYMNESVRYPKVLAQPGSSIALAHSDGYIYLNQVGYTACAYDGDGRDEVVTKTYNTSQSLYHPAFNIKRADLGKIDSQTKKAVAIGLAKHQVVSILFHYTDIDNDNSYLGVVEEFLKWCKANDVPLLTISQWMTNLYNSTPDPTINVFPDITKDLDGDGIGDGYNAFYNNESKLVIDPTAPGGNYIARTQLGSFFEITQLGGIEKGGNVVSFYAKGDIGAEIQVQITTNNQQTINSIKLDSPDWKKYEINVDIPQSGILSNVNILLKDAKSQSYTVVISDWKLSKAVKNPVTNILSDKTITTKESIILSAEPGCSNYLWNSGETTQSITFDGANYGPGSFPVSYTSDDSAGALVADHAKITVNGIKVSTTSLTLDAKNSAKSFDIIANIPWTIHTQNGLAITNINSEASATLNTKTITVTMADNTSLNPKDDVINIETALGITPVAVTQKGMDPIFATTVAPTSITTTGATLNAQVNASNTTATVSFEYGTTLTYTNALSGTPKTITGNTLTNVSTSISGLISNTTYNFRVKATNESGPVYGNNIVFKTLPDLPATPVANNASDALQTSFTANWTPSAKAIGYRLDVATDNTFSTLLTDYNNKEMGTNISCNVIGLKANTTYYYRVRAYNTDGDGSSSDVITISTLPNPPDAPVVDTASNVLLSTFTTKWSPIATATGYKLDIAIDNTFTSFVDGYKNKDVGNVTSYGVTGLTANTTYYFRIRAYSASVESINSNINTVTTLVNPPLAPVANNAFNVQQTSFGANWNNVENATSYLLDVATDNSFTDLLPDYKNKEIQNNTSFSVTGLQPNTTYYYQLRAHNRSGFSPYSKTIMVITLPDPPATPTVDTASVIKQTSFNVNWKSTSTSTSYLVDISTDSGFATFIPGFNSMEVVNSTSINVSGLKANTTYYYRIRAHNAGGDSQNSSTITVTTLPNPPYNPTIKSASDITQTSCSLNWSSAPSAIGYRMDIAINNEFTTFYSDFTLKKIGIDTMITLTGLTPNTTYFYRVSAYNNGGSSSSPGINSFTTLPNPPAAPVIDTASLIKQTGFTANWKSVVKANGYLLDVALDHDFTTFIPDYKRKDVGNILSFNLTGLIENTIYYYRVHAYNTGGFSADSIATMVATLPYPPVPPVLDTATVVRQSGFTANWKKSPTATGYKLDVAIDADFRSISWSFNLGDVNSLNVKGLSALKTYYYRVLAYNKGGASIYNDKTTVTTLPNPPKAPKTYEVTVKHQTSFIVSWGSVDSLKGYRLDVSKSRNFTDILSGYNHKQFTAETSDSVFGLTPYTTYYFRVCAYNVAGESGYTDTISVITLPSPPSPPTGIITTNRTKSGFTFICTPAIMVTGYLLDIATDTLFSNTISPYKSMSVDINAPVSIIGLQPKTQYFYRLRAYNSGGIGTNSVRISITTLSTPPTPPSIIKVSSCGNVITLKYQRSTGTDVNRYRIYGGLTTNPTKVIDTTLNMKTDSLNIYNLNKNQKYYFSMTAVNTDGPESVKSNDVSETVRYGVVPVIKSKWGSVLVCYNLGDSIKSFQWYKNGVAILNATNQYYSTNKQPGTYFVKIIDKNGCSYPSNNIVITGLKSLAAFPNPTAESFSLKVNDESEGKTVVTVFNTSGIKVVEFQTESLKNELLKEISVKNLNAGVYVVQVVFNNEDFYYTKIIVKK